MSEQAPTGDDGLLRESQQAIDEAKAAAAEVVGPDGVGSDEDTPAEVDLVDDGLPAAARAEPADGPAPAA
ncbi:hypothetical protein ACLBWP_17620 [Microbacterium sp. M1A1_1b]